MTKNEMINQIAGTSITLTKTELEEMQMMNDVWAEIAQESIAKTQENFESKEGWQGYEFTDDYLYRIEFTEEGIRYYEGTEERYMDIPVGEESWNEPQWTEEEVRQLLEGLEG